jgi:uncharacterized protein
LEELAIFRHQGDVMKAFVSLLGSMLFFVASTAHAADLHEGIRATHQHDYAAAIAEFTPLAEQGEAEAQYQLGLLFLFGHGVPRDDAQANAWFRKAFAGFSKAAADGSAEAQDRLGGMYITGDGVHQDYTQAAAWFSKSAAQGNANAQYHLGIFVYANGYGAPQDWTKAVSWYSKAAAQGNVQAQFALGLLNYHGVHVPKNYANALAWFREGAAQGDPESFYELSKMYADGAGVPQDAIAAYALLTFPGIPRDSVPNGLVDDDYRCGLTAKMTADQIGAGTALGREMQRDGVLKALANHAQAYAK